MVGKYKKGDFDNGRGLLCSTVDGPMYKYKELWISPLAYKVAKENAEKWGIQEKVVLSKMIEQYVAESCTVQDRLALYKETTLPELVKKHKKNENNQDTEEE